MDEIEAGRSPTDLPGIPTVAEKLDFLFRTVHPRGRGPYSYKEAARGIERETGTAVSDTTLWKLRTGRLENPTKRVIEALATFFGVSPAYFFDDSLTHTVEEQLELLALLRDAEVQGMQLRTFAKLSPEARQLVNQLIQNAARLEQGQA